MTTYKNFKQICELIANIKTDDDRNNATAEIDKSYQHDKITAKDNEILYSLIRTIDKLRKTQ